MTIGITKHAKKRIKEYGLDAQQVHRIILSKMKIRRGHVHWIVIKTVPYRKNGRASGDTLIGVVRSGRGGRYDLTTVMLRDSRQAFEKYCDYLWR